MMVDASCNLVELYKNAAGEGLIEFLRQRLNFYGDIFLLPTLIAVALLMVHSFDHRVPLQLLLLIFLSVAVYWWAALREAKKFPSIKQEEKIKAATVGVGIIILGYENPFRCWNVYKRRERIARDRRRISRVYKATAWIATKKAMEVAVTAGTLQDL